MKFYLPLVSLFPNRLAMLTILFHVLISYLYILKDISVQIPFPFLLAIIIIRIWVCNFLASPFHSYFHSSLIKWFGKCPFQFSSFCWWSLECIVVKVSFNIFFLRFISETIVPGLFFVEKLLILHRQLHDRYWQNSALNLLTLGIFF